MYQLTIVPVQPEKGYANKISWEPTPSIVESMSLLRQNSTLSGKVITKRVLVDVYRKERLITFELRNATDVLLGHAHITENK